MAYIPAAADPTLPPVRINLLSDTQTKPSPAMREAIARAEVGDEILAHETAHILTSEGGAHAALGGLQILPLTGARG